MVLDGSVAINTSDHQHWRNTAYAVDQPAVVSAPQAAVPQYTVGSLLRSMLLAKSSAPVYTAPVSSYDAEAWSLINANIVAADYPYKGAGYSVAVIDTGIDPNTTSLSGRIIAGWNFVANNANTADDNGHGTFVATEIAGNNATYPGIATQTNVIPLKVLDASGSGNFGSVEDALNWVVDHRAQYNIVAVNMSLGSGNYSTSPATYLDASLSTLKSQGVFVAVASGNGFFTANSTPGLGFPAIDSLVVSVGAVYDSNVGSVTWSSGAADYSTAADRIASFTQRNGSLSILAPGALITGIGPSNYTITLGGTSMASPIIAAAAVLIHQALDAVGHGATANQDTILSIMQSTGVTVVDGDDENDNVVNTGLVFKRLNLLAAIQYVVNISPPDPSYPVQPGFITGGSELVGVFDGPIWTLYVYNPSAGTTQQTAITFGGAGDKPIVGNWNGSGYGAFGVYRNGTWYLDYNGSGIWDSGDRTFLFGIAGDIPVAGDWEGNGKAEVGVFRPSTGMWYLDFNGNGGWDSGDMAVQFGIANDRPVVGDWNGDGREKIGVFRNGLWYLDWNGNRGWDSGDRTIVYGAAGDLPMVANFAGDANREISILRNSTWYIDNNRSFGWDGTPPDKIVVGTTPSFSSTQVLVAGRWNPLLLNVRSTAATLKGNVALSGTKVPVTFGRSISQEIQLTVQSSIQSQRSRVLDETFASLGPCKRFVLPAASEILISDVTADESVRQPSTENDTRSEYNEATHSDDIDTTFASMLSDIADDDRLWELVS